MVRKVKTMKKKSFVSLEFNTILDMLSEFAQSNNVKEKIKSLEPFMKESEVKRHLHETTEAKNIMVSLGSPPLAIMKNLDKIFLLVEQGSMLTPENLNYLVLFITTCRRMKKYLLKAEIAAPKIAQYAKSIDSLDELYDAIINSIRGDNVDDRASKELQNIRRKINAASEQVKIKLNSLLSTNSKYFSESFVSNRCGHYTLPVKKEYKNQVKGRVVDMSKSGATLFIEPSSVAKAQNKIDILNIEQDNEIIKILYTLTNLVGDYQAEININIEAMELLDYMFAKAKLSESMNGIPAKVTTSPGIIIKKGRHPLLDKDECVPLDFELDGTKTKRIIITGPNTGGKTVVLKTVGLFSLMSQSGLHVPADEATICMQNAVLCDVGDGQSITENLSTFSSHMTNIIKIISLANEQSLVLLDELGSGTDPTEGMGLAVAILEELASKNCLLVSTTHYPQIKDFAKTTSGFINARMAFDKEKLCSLYKIEIGEAGESCALYIAKNLGLPHKLISRAYDAAYDHHIFNTTNKYKIDDISVNAIDTKPSKSPLASFEKISSRIAIDKEIKEKFSIGDSVKVLPSKETGIVFKSADSRGDVCVQVKNIKSMYNHKRVKLLIPASELYPEDYDMSIVFDSVENRKATRIISKRYDANAKVKRDQ